MNNLLIFFLLIVGSVWCGYTLGLKDKGLEFEEYKLQAEKAYNLLLEQKIARDAEIEAKFTQMERDYASKVQKLKSEHDAVIADMRKSFNPNGVLKHNCTSSKTSERETSNTDRIICYARKDLLSRIEKTLAIGNDCDVLQAKYKTLLDMVKEYNAEK